MRLIYCHVRDNVAHDKQKSRANLSAKKFYVDLMVFMMGMKIQFKLLVRFCVTSLFLLPTRAGERKVRYLFRILNGVVGGEETATNGYPWQARLEDKVF